MVLTAFIAVKVGKTPPQNSAGHEPVQLIQHELRQRPAVGRIGPMLLEGQQVLLEHLIKRCLSSGCRRA
jgi:hypothetical protein